MNKKKAILVVSFGTSYDETRKKTIEAIEQDIHHAFPDFELRRAFTSPTIRRILKNRDGIEVDDVAGALERLAAEGYRYIIVQPTHVIRGFEYDAVREIIGTYDGRFEQLFLGDALLTSEEDYHAAAQAVLGELEAYRRPDTMIVMMGHGTEHVANESYRKLQHIFEGIGIRDIRIATVEAETELDDLIREIRECGVSRVVLFPFMVVAGDHACNDMAGAEETSWKSRFEKAGFNVQCILRGLGEYAPIREIYVKHAKNAEF
jgi:sirohydrochlorin cobaltochelatase